MIYWKQSVAPRRYGKLEVVVPSIRRAIRNGYCWFNQMPSRDKPKSARALFACMRALENKEENLHDGNTITKEESSRDEETTTRSNANICRLQDKWFLLQVAADWAPLDLVLLNGRFDFVSESSILQPEWPAQRDCGLFEDDIWAAEKDD